MLCKSLSQCAVQILEECHEDRYEAALLRVSIGENDWFAILIDDGEECALECVNLSLGMIQENFQRVAEGKLASCHLRDWIGDLYRKVL